MKKLLLSGMTVLILGALAQQVQAISTMPNCSTGFTSGQVAASGHSSSNSHLNNASTAENITRLPVGKCANTSSPLSESDCLSSYEKLGTQNTGYVCHWNPKAGACVRSHFPCDDDLANDNT